MRIQGLLLSFVFIIGLAESAPPRDVLGELFIRKNAYLRTEPTKFGKRTAKLRPGLKVKVLRANTNAQYFRIETPSGRDGYVLKTSLSRSRPRPSGKTAAKTKNSEDRNIASNEEPPAMLSDVPMAPSAEGDEPSVDDQADFTGEGDADDAVAATGNPYTVKDAGESAEAEAQPAQAAPQKTDSIYEEYEDLYGDADRAEERAQAKKKPQEKKQAKKNKKSDVDFAAYRWSVGAGLEYANQFSHDSTHGWGLGAYGLYSFNSSMAVGLSLSWNRFSETVTYTNVFVESSRTASRILMGPMFRYTFKFLRFDAVLGWDRVSSQFKATNTQTGEDLTSLAGAQYVGKITENAFGLNLRASYAWEFQDNMALEAYLGYGIGFHGGESVSGSSGSTPQQLSLGAAYNLQF